VGHYSTHPCPWKPDHPKTEKATLQCQLASYNFF